MPAGQAVFGRSFFALPVVIVWLWLRHDLATGLRTANPWGHAWRGAVGSAAMLMGFGALGLLPLPQVTAIGYAMPVFTLVLAVLFLREPIRLFRTLAVALGVAGVAIVAWPDLVARPEGSAAVRFWGTVLALGGALLGGVAQVIIRRLVETEDAAAIVFYFQLSAALFGLATLPLGALDLGLQPWSWPTAGQWALLVAAGALGSVGQILHTSAYRFAPASVIAPFEYASILLAILIGYTLFAEVPERTTLLGAAIVTGAGILIIWREGRLGIRRGRARAAKSPAGTP